MALLALIGLYIKIDKQLVDTSKFLSSIIDGGSLLEWTVYQDTLALLWLGDHPRPANISHWA